MKTFILTLSAVALLSCSPQKRANRLFNRAIKLNPELIKQFDTVLEITDTTYLKGDTIRTEIKDTVIIQGRVKVQIKDRFVTVTTPADTIIKPITVKVKGKAYPVYKDEPFYKENSFPFALVFGMGFIGILLILAATLLGNKK